jgi:hypothetical protein
MATVYIDTATTSGSFIDGQNFDFQISSSQTGDVTITGRDQEGGNDSWFTPDPATIPGGSTSVTVKAQQITPIGEYVTYLVGNRNTNGNAHIVVGDSMQEQRKRAS